MSENFIVVSSDCHAGLPIAQYKDYTEEKYHEMLDMAVPITIEMSQKASESFLIKDINDEWRKGIEQQLTGAWDYKERVKMLDADGIAAEIIFPDGITEINTPPFGAGLSMPTKDMVPELVVATTTPPAVTLVIVMVEELLKFTEILSIPQLSVDDEDEEH